MLCSIINICSSTFATPLQGAVLGAVGSPTLLSIVGNRMFYNLKEAAERGVNVGTNWSSYSHSGIRFEDPAECQMQAGTNRSSYSAGAIEDTRSRLERYVAHFMTPRP